MKLEIKPYVSVGPIQLGMSREQVRSLLKSPFKEFMKSPLSKVSTDNFQELSFHVYYWENNTVKGVEVHPPNEVFMDEKPILGQPFENVLEWLQKLDPALHVNDTGAISMRCGISLYAPESETNPKDPIQAVYPFAKGVFKHLE